MEIQGVGLHYPTPGAICLNGVIYYRSKSSTYDTTSMRKLMSFDARSEGFCHLEAPSTLRDYFSTIINYQGKLGFMCCEKGMEIWVREDCGKNTQQWSKIFFYKMEGLDKLRISGATRGGDEVILVKWNYKYEDMLGVYYYDPKQNSMRFVDLGNAYADERKPQHSVEIWTLLDYVDNTIYLY